MSAAVLGSGRYKEIHGWHSEEEIFFRSYPESFLIWQKNTAYM